LSVRAPARPSWREVMPTKNQKIPERTDLGRESAEFIELGGNHVDREFVLHILGNTRPVSAPTTARAAINCFLAMDRLCTGECRIDVGEGCS